MPWLAITVIFYSVVKILWKFLCILCVCVRSQVLNLRAKKEFGKYLKIVRNPILPDFRQFLTYFQNLIYIWLLSHPNDMQKKFIKFLLQDKNWQRLQNCNFQMTCKFLSRLGKSTHMSISNFDKKWVGSKLLMENSIILSMPSLCKFF